MKAYSIYYAWKLFQLFHFKKKSKISMKMPENNYCENG